jgi:Zn-finger nucleic acid-binding protein
MNCPRCETSVLDEREREVVTVDVCREFRGTWLDRGELEKIVARTSQDMEARDSRRRRDHGDGRRPQRKRGWLESVGDLFN